MQDHYLRPNTQLPRAIKINDKASRFASIQHIWREDLHDPEMMQKIIDSGQHDQPEGYTEAIMELRDTLGAHIAYNIPKICTAKQYQALTLYITGLYTQTEIANQLGTHQTNVHKLIWGNINYRTEPPRRTGGAIDNIRKWATTNPRCIELLQEIRDCRAEDFQ